MKKKTSAIWTITLVIFFFYLLYQSTFAWDKEETQPITETTVLPEDKTAFIVVKDTHFGVKRSAIKSVKESLEQWDFDKKYEKVVLKHENLLPTEKTQMMVLYDKGYDSFAHHSDVLSLVNFPYSHFYEGDVVFDVNGVNKNGDVYLSYDNKRIHLSPGETYYAMSSEGYKVTWTTIKNYGLYDKSQFELKGQKTKQKDGGESESINIDTLEKSPLEATKPKYKDKPVVDIQETFFMEEEKKKDKDE